MITAVSPSETPRLLSYEEAVRLYEIGLSTLKAAPSCDAASEGALRAELIAARAEARRRSDNTLLAVWEMPSAHDVLPRDAPADATIGPASTGVAVLIREGQYWTLTYGDVTTRLKDTKGLDYLVHLLRHPGEEVLAIDLARMMSASDEAPSRRASTDGIPDPFGDRAARAAYKRRLVELAEEYEEAERLNDVGRAERAAAEREMLADYVHRTSGLGGRARRVHSDLERGRSAVGKRIKTVLERIRAEQPVLGRFLAATIRTGYACSYRPDRDAAIVWKV